MNYKMRLTIVSLFIFITLLYIWIPSAKEAGYIFVTAWGTKGKKPGQFRVNNYRIQVFSSESFIRSKWGGPFALNISGYFNGWFATVTSVAIGPEGNIFTTDFYNNRVQEFTANGIFLSCFGEQGDGAGQFDRAVAVATAPNGAVFVVDLGNNRIQKWQPL
jgi:DNA-binding beta-propeller fold protein YncE